MHKSFYTLGVDPAKENATACLVDHAATIVFGPRDFACSRAGWDDLIAQLARHVADHQRLTVGIECTAALDDNLLALFATMRTKWDLVLIRVDSAQARGFRGARPVRGKTDRADARRIAEFTRTYAEQLARFVDTPQLLAMQRLVNERLALGETLAAEKNRLRDRLVISFPEFTEVFSDPSNSAALALLRVAPTAAHVAKKRLSTLAALRCPRANCKQVGNARAQKLRELARTSIASACTETDAATLRRIAQRIEMLIEQQHEIDAQLEQFVQKTPPPDEQSLQTQPDVAHQTRILSSLPGLRTLSASAIVLRSSGLRRFSCAKALAAQLALCPERNQTGSSSDSSHLTYRGDRRARALVYLATLAACRTDIAFAFHHWRMVHAGKTKIQATCACMNRLIRLAWTLVNTHTPYDPNRSITNAIKHHPHEWTAFLEQSDQLGKTLCKKLQNLTTEALT